MNEWLILCFTKSIIKRASITALVVGTILIVINHGDVILTGQVDSNRLFKIALTICVPYIVATVSSASTIISMKKNQEK